MFRIMHPLGKEREVWGLAGTRSRARCARVAGPHSWQAVGPRRAHRNAVLCARARSGQSRASTSAKMQSKAPADRREGEGGREWREGRGDGRGRPARRAALDAVVCVDAVRLGVSEKNGEGYRTAAL